MTSAFHKQSPDRPAAWSYEPARLYGKIELRRQPDEGGRQVGADAYRYAWQAGGLLVAVSRGGQRLVSYRYTYRGKRIEKHSAEGTRYFLYQDRKLTAELSWRAFRYRWWLWNW